MEEFSLMANIKAEQDAQQRQEISFTRMCRMRFTTSHYDDEYDEDGL
jgi:hypothetical protein